MEKSQQRTSPLGKRFRELTKFRLPLKTKPTSRLDCGTTMYSKLSKVILFVAFILASSINTCMAEMLRATADANRKLRRRGRGKREGCGEDSVDCGQGKRLHAHNCTQTGDCPGNPDDVPKQHKKGEGRKKGGQGKGGHGKRLHANRDLQEGSGEGCGGGNGAGCKGEECGDGEGVICEGKDPGTVPKQEQKKEGTKKRGNGRVLPGGPRDGTGEGCEGDGLGCEGEDCDKDVVGCDGKGPKGIGKKEGPKDPNAAPKQHKKGEGKQEGGKKGEE